jgi:uncharacterized protein YjbI with pentapeptide repeats
MGESKPRSKPERARGSGKGTVSKIWIWGLAAVATVGVILVLYWLPWAGFSGSYGPEGEWRGAKTLWDWIDLLLAPGALVAGVLVLSQAIRQMGREAEERRARTEWEITLDRSRETALQAYLDRMMDLMGDGLRGSDPGDVKRTIARARTLAVLRQLDVERKGLLLQFLHGSGLIGKGMEKEGETRQVIVDLRKADLSGANLRGADLSEADLSEVNLNWTNLKGANLAGANLREADLEGVNLRGSDLRWADLKGARLSNADLIGTDLRWANLESADLSRANLSRAMLYEAHLEGANLSRAYAREVNLSKAHAGEADLNGADLSRATLHEANLEGANLSHANLSSASLGEACLAWTKLQGADLRNAILSHAYLGGANLEGANLEGAEATHEQLHQARSLEGAILPDGTKQVGAPPAEKEAEVPALAPVEEEVAGSPKLLGEPGHLEAGSGSGSASLPDGAADELEG